MMIAQISDTHIQAPGVDPFMGVDNNENLQRAVAAVMAMTPRPDLVLLTGDLAFDGTPAEYDALRQLLAPLAIPHFLIPGNHDEHALLRNTFPDHGYLKATGEFIQYVVDDYPLRMITFDSTVVGHHHGAVCETRLQWLAERLAERPDQPTLLFTHHPPIQTGIWWMDGIGLIHGVKPLRELLDAHPQIQRLICGHVHRAIHGNFGRTAVSVCPSTGIAIQLDMIPEAEAKVITEPPAFQVHTWNDGALVTHTVYFDDSRQSLDLTPKMPDWEERKLLARKREGTPKRPH